MPVSGFERENAPKARPNNTRSRRNPDNPDNSDGPMARGEPGAASRPRPCSKGEMQ